MENQIRLKEWQVKSYSILNPSCYGWVKHNGVDIPSNMNNIIGEIVGRTDTSNIKAALLLEENGELTIKKNKISLYKGRWQLKDSILELKINKEVINFKVKHVRKDSLAVFLDQYKRLSNIQIGLEPV